MKNRMAGERILSLVEKYLAGDVLLLLIGLLHSEDGVRGFPFAWLGGGVDNARFAMSAAVLAVVVIAADVIARSITAAKEPKMQIITKPVKADASYTAKAPSHKKPPQPLKKPYKPASPVRSAAQSSSGPGYASEPGSGHASGANSASGQINIPRISGDSVREFGKTLSKGVAGPGTGKDDNSSKTLGLAFAVIFIAISMIASVFSAIDFDDGFEVDLDDDSLIAEDEYEESPYSDIYEEVCQTYIDYLMCEDVGSADEMLAGSSVIADALGADAEDSMWYSEEMTMTLDDGRLISRYLIQTSDSRYLLALLLDPDADMLGAAVCERPTGALYKYFGTLSLGDGTLSEEKEAQLVNFVKEHAAATGETELEGASILLY